MELEVDTSPQRFFVIAGSYHEFRYWCHVNQKREGPWVVYVADVRSLMGYILFPKDEVVRIGTYYGRKDINEIEHELKVRMKYDQR
jgi:hypothetical protein